MAGGVNLPGGPPLNGPVIFDLDGVMVDSEIWWDEVRQAFAADHGWTWGPEDQAAVMGANSAAWSRTMRERLELDLTDLEIERAIIDGVVDRYRNEGPPLIDGAVAAVERIAARHPVAVASSAHREVIDAALASIGLAERFSVVVSSDEVAHGKPAPDVYLEAARRLMAVPEDCLVVEDSRNGVLAARAAGMTVVLVPNHSVPPAPGTVELADVVLERLADLEPAAIERSAARAIMSPPEPSARATPRRPLPGPAVGPWRRAVRYWASRLVVAALARAWLRPRVEGREHLPPGPAIYCFNHLCWVDPFLLMATLPLRPRLFFFGPREEDMLVGARNRIMHWSATTIPYKPGKNDLLEATRRVAAVIESGGVMGIAGEGRIGAIESTILPLNDGPAYFALRSHVPLVPIALSGTSWLPFGGRVRVRIGEPLDTTVGRADRASIAATTATLSASLAAMVADAPTPTRPGRIGAWLSEAFNDWPEGSREAAAAAQLAGGVAAPTVSEAGAAAPAPAGSAAASPAAEQPVPTQDRA